VSRISRGKGSGVAKPRISVFQPNQPDISFALQRGIFERPKIPEVVIVVCFTMPTDLVRMLMGWRNINSFISQSDLDEVGRTRLEVGWKAGEKKRRTWQAQG